MPGPRPQGERALTAAERMARMRARQAEARPPAKVRYRKPQDRRSKPQRWADAVAELLELQADYQMWLETLPPGLTESATADLLNTVCALDLSELEAMELPKGFGRD